MEKRDIEGISCYFLSDIKTFLGPSAYLVFCGWYYGQTGMISKEGELCVYSWDWDKFVSSHTKLLEAMKND